MKTQIKLFSTAFVAMALLAGCGKKKAPDGPKGGSSKGGTPAKLAKVELDSVEEVEAFYEADPEFFRIKTTADIPTDLKWEDGSNEPVFSSPKAKRGGTMSVHTGDWPRTLRFVGPDASGSFRRHILDSNALGLVESHPETDGYWMRTS